MEQIAKEYAGKVKVVGINVDNSPDVTARLGVMSIPAMLFFKNGQEVARVIGAVPKSKLIDEIKRAFGV